MSIRLEAYPERGATLRPCLICEEGCMNALIRNPGTAKTFCTLFDPDLFNLNAYFKAFRPPIAAIQLFRNVLRLYRNVHIKSAMVKQQSI